MTGITNISIQVLKNKIIFKNEYTDGIFYPNRPITREEMAVMIVRAMNYNTMAVEVNNQISQFKDVKQKVVTSK